MKIILSPAKKMEPADDSGYIMSKPLFESEANMLLEKLRSYDYDSLKAIFKASDKVCQPIYELYQAQKKGRTFEKYPAILTYSGIAFQYMAPGVLEDEALAYLQEHLLILSGLYGALRPMDSIGIYRLEMAQKPGVNLYEFWPDKLAPLFENETVLNLASKEYSKAVKGYANRIDVRFEELDEKGYKEKGVYAKMARGAIVRFCAQNQIETVEQIKAFTDQGYKFDEQASSNTLYIFRRKPQKKGLS
jgi:cytoplasmic iron level regulating protein YaaA (DUF328/UPF0246 family)